jgi:hypothetical protein
MKLTRSLSTRAGLEGPITGPNAGPAGCAEGAEAGGGEGARAGPGGGILGPMTVGIAAGSEPGPRGRPRWCST